MVPKMAIRTRHAKQIRAGIQRALYVQSMLDAINLNPTTFAAMVLGDAVLRASRLETSRLEQRAYLRTRAASRSSAPSIPVSGGDKTERTEQ